MRRLRSAARLAGQALRRIEQWAFTVERLFRDAHAPLSPISLVLVGLAALTYALYALEARFLFAVAEIVFGLWYLLFVMTLPRQGP